MIAYATSMAGQDLLGHAIRAQLDALIGWAGLPPDAARKAVAIFYALTDGALQRPATPPFDGLSQINANGLPFQWSFSFGRDGARSLRFLCEPGQPGASPQARFMHARACLAHALDATNSGSADWLDACVFPHLIPASDAWPEHWRSAMWFGAGAAAAGVLIKPYVNLNWGAPLERWRRVGQVFASLGREQALARLCHLSGQVSRDSWPAGIAFDVLPDGSCGRIKIYFQSAAVGPDWLQRWYAAVGALEHAPALRTLLDAFPYLGHARFPARAFVLSLEFHGEVPTLKTDLAITRWMHDDAAIAAGIRRCLRHIGASPLAFEAAQHSIDAWPPDDQSTRSLRFVGLGHEPDGSCHVNVYVEPPLPDRPPLRAQPAGRTHKEAIRAGLQFLIRMQKDGMWHDYNLPVGVADQWITAYVLWMLAGLPFEFRSAALNDAIGAACARLLDMGYRAGGWGYNATTGSDADSTSIAILALRAHGFPVPSSALDFLVTCHTNEGGMATYPPGTQPEGSWNEACNEVSAVALLALAGEGRVFSALKTYLDNARRADGMWQPFWWHTPLYPTYVALLTEPGSSHEALRSTLRDHDCSGAFETALHMLCCQGLGLAGGRSRAHELRMMQTTDGSWPPSALLRLASPAARDPASTIEAGPSYLDTSAVFTTVTAIAALLQEPAAR